MRSNGASPALRSPSVIARAAFALPVPTSCTYTIAWNSAHLVGMRADAMRLGGRISTPSLIRLRRTLLRFGNDTERVQAIDFGRVESQFAENLVVVPSDFRSALRRYFGNAMHLDRTADRRGQPFAGALERNDDVIRSQLWIVDHLFRSAHSAERDVHAAEDLVPMRHRLRAEDVVEDRRQLWHVCDQLRRLGEPRIRQQIGPADRLGPRRPLVRSGNPNEPPV